MEDIFEELAAVGSDDDGQAEENDQGGSGNRDDEAEEANDTKRVVKPKRVISRPRPKLNPQRLLGERGIFTIKSSFENIKFKGKGHELDDLNNVLSRLQHWAHRLFPKMTFEDCIQRIEELGNKREIQVNMHKIRSGIIDLDSGLPAQDDDGAGNDRGTTPPPDDNTFDLLVAAAVPAPVAAPQTTLTYEQRARMMRNRVLAEERRLARQLARQKEKEQQGQGSSAANVGVNLSSSVSADSAGGIFASVCNERADQPMSENEPSCRLDGSAPGDNTSQDLSLNQESGNTTVFLDSVDIISSSSGKKSTSLVVEEKEFRNVSSLQCHLDLERKTVPVESDAAEKEFDEQTDSPFEVTSNPKPKEARALSRYPSNKTNIDSTIDSHLAESVTPEVFLEVHESELMGVESTPKSNIDNMSRSSSADAHSQSSLAPNAKPSISSQTSVAVVDDLMDVGSAEDWGEAFAEAEQAPASQNQPAS